jgi:hypothetical protein
MLLIDDNEKNSGQVHIEINSVQNIESDEVE